MTRPESGTSRFVPFQSAAPEEVFHIEGVGVVYEESAGVWAVITGAALADILNSLATRGDLLVTSHDAMGEELCSTWPECEDLIEPSDIESWREHLLSKYILHWNNQTCRIGVYPGMVFECPPL
jgi:hypothetical protein